MSKVTFLAGGACLAVLVGVCCWWIPAAQGEPASGPSGLRVMLHAAFAESSPAIACPSGSCPSTTLAYGQSLSHRLNSEASIVLRAVCNDAENCPGADEGCLGVWRPLVAPSAVKPAAHEEELSDRSLAETLSEIEHLRRERASHALRGSLLDEGAQTEREFAHALRRVAEHRACAPSTQNTACNDRTGCQAETPNFDHIARCLESTPVDDELVITLRSTARLLDDRSHDAEAADDLGAADRLHHLADRLRHEARFAAGTAYPPPGPAYAPGPVIGSYPTTFFVPPPAPMFAAPPTFAPAGVFAAPPPGFTPAAAFQFPGCMNGQCPGNGQQLHFEFALPFGAGFAFPVEGDILPASAAEELPPTEAEPVESNLGSRAVRAAVGAWWKKLWK